MRWSKLEEDDPITEGPTDVSEDTTHYIEDLLQLFIKARVICSRFLGTIMIDSALL